MARQKNVYKTEEIAHLWMHKTQDSARNSAHNFYFEGATIYSYGPHFPIARHVENARGEAAILFTTRGYSPTTAKHIHNVRHAIPSRAVPVFHVPLSRDSWASPTPVSYWEYYEKEADSLLETARKAKGNMSQRLAKLDAHVTEANEFAVFYDLPQRLELPPDWDALQVLASEYEAKQASINARSEATRRARNSTRWEANRQASEARQQQRIQDYAENIEAWLAGQSIDYWKVQDGDVRLRIVAGEIETTKGARIPVGHALKALPLIRRVWASGGEYHRNGHTIHLGNYNIDAVTQDVVIAGCHTVARAEVERIAALLDAAAPCEVGQ